jgi:hypothetical protein
MICIVAGDNHSIPAWDSELDVTGTEQMLRKCFYRWSRGLSSSSSGCPEERHPANKKIHERGIGRFHES